VLVASVLAVGACSGSGADPSTASVVEGAAQVPTAVSDPEVSTDATEATPASTDAVDTTASGTAGEDATPAIVAAADAFLATLTDAERDAVLFDFSDNDQRQQWSNLPEGLYERDGLMWGNLDEDSKQGWLAVLEAILSDEGYEQVLGEWHADDELGGGNYGEAYYWVAIIGQPSETEAWQFQFGGHHVTVNATIKGADVSVTPSFIGVQPAIYDADGNEIRPLGTIEDDAYALVGALDSEQQSMPCSATR